MSRRDAYVGIALALAAACGGSEEEKDATAGCSAGTTRTCVGPGACRGVQTCSAERLWSNCLCAGVAYTPCLSSLDCPPAEVCDTAAGRCVACVANTGSVSCQPVDAGGGASGGTSGSGGSGGGGGSSGGTSGSGGSGGTSGSGGSGGTSGSGGSGGTSGSGGSGGGGGSSGGCGGQGECLIADETTTASLSCPAGVICSIDFASFGTPQGSCGTFGAGGCHANGQSVVASACIGQSSCAVDVSTAVFGDPCFGVRKALYVEFTCGPTP